MARCCVSSDGDERRTKRTVGISIEYVDGP
jgi:hypothetical protein